MRFGSNKSKRVEPGLRHSLTGREPASLSSAGGLGAGEIPHLSLLAPMLFVATFILTQGFTLRVMDVRMVLVAETVTTLGVSLARDVGCRERCGLSACPGGTS